MSALGVQYKVKEGDTLWDIAKNELGSSQEWPRIYAFNNMPEINASGALTVGFAAWVYCSGGLGTVNTPQYAYAMSVILAVGG